MDAELTPPAAVAAKTTTPSRSAKHKTRAAETQRAAEGEVDTAKKSRSGKNTPGQQRASGKHKAKARSCYRDIVKLARVDFEQQAEERAAELSALRGQITALGKEQAAELSALRRQVTALGLEVDIANKRRFKAEATLERLCGCRVARFALST